MTQQLKEAQTATLLQEQTNNEETKMWYLQMEPR